MFIVGISLLYLVYFNASIYWVKGGRLGLMPGVLFHSCRPSFHHTGVMFLDFAFLTRLGDLWDPLTVRFEQNSSSKAQPWFYHLPPKPFPLGFREPEGHLILTPPGQCSFECWSELSRLRGPLMETLGWLTRRLAHPVCPENEICAAPIGICRHIWVVLLV